MSEQYGWLRGGVKNTDPFKAPIDGVMPIYSSHRFGKPRFGTSEWGYDIPFETPGMYTCIAHFGENSPTVTKVGDRVFDLSFSSGTAAPTTFKNVDVYKASRGKVSKIHTIQTTIAIAGTLKIRVKKTAASPNGAFISAISCTKTTAPVPVSKPVSAPFIPVTPEPSPYAMI